MKIATKLTTVVTPALLVAAAATNAHAGVKLGDTTHLDLSLDATVNYTDNIYNASTSKTSDVYSTISPGFTITHEAVNQFTISFYESFTNYVDHGELDSQLASASLSYVFDPRALVGDDDGVDAGPSRLRVSLHASFNQVVQNNNTLIEKGKDLSTLVETETYSAGANFSYGLSSKIDLNVGFNFNESHYDTLHWDYNDSRSFSAPVRLGYRFTNYQVGLGYTWTNTDMEESRRQKATNAAEGYKVHAPGSQISHYGNIWFQGAIPGTSKVSLHADAGVGRREFEERITSGVDADRAYTTFNYNFGLTWQVRSNISVLAASGRTFDVGGLAQSITTTYGRLSLNASIFTYYRANVYVDYRQQEFDTNSRRDNVYSGGLLLSYTTYVPSVKTSVTATVGYRHLRDDSNAIRDFDVNTAYFSLGFRY
jgi:hypothetical protein